MYCTGPMFEMHSAYLQHGDLAKIIGLISSRIGLQYHDHGLRVRLSHNNDVTQPIGDLELCSDPGAVLGFLGFDHARILESFDTMDDIFDFAINTKYFDPRFFRTKVFNHNFRAKTTKRKMYTRFLDVLEERFPDSDESKPRVDVALDAIHHFGKDKEYDALMEAFFHKKEVSEKFNGDVVHRLTGLERQGLGDAMRTLKARPDFMRLVDKGSRQEVEDAIKEILVGR
eukprot:TRINITY_DN10186_c0_g1_i2.p1 TRINITY_DN10186_c0_g1~~TRINITY_DN10186_c0_g1_i2.p1  ORF type:complete len:228 (-),score=59.73 TRINITY_DN10186_c0_g1_i2:17-700(-)